MLFARAGLDPSLVMDAPEHEVLALLAAMPKAAPMTSLTQAVQAAPPGVTRKRFVSTKKKA